MRVQQLRDKAARCLRLAQSINAPADVALLEALAAEASQAAADLESIESAPSNQIDAASAAL